MNTRSDQATVWLAAGALVPFVGVLSYHVAQYVPFLPDDALISLRYARRMLDGAGLTWTDGHPVEGYSSLLWVLIISLAGRLGMDLVDAARIAGVGCTVGVLFSVAWWNVRRSGFAFAWLPALVGLAFLAFAQPLAAWSVGGLEQPLVAALLAAAIPLTFRILDREEAELRRAVWLSVVLGLLCLASPAGLIFSMVTLAVLAVTGRGARRPGFLAHPLVAALGTVISAGGQLVFRLLYYGEWLPNRASVTFAPSDNPGSGLDYLSSAFWALWPLSGIAIAAVAVLIVGRSSRNRGVLLGAMATVWSIYVIGIGGDALPAYRQVTPLLVILAFALSDAAFAIVQILGTRRVLLAGLAVVMATAIIPYARRQADDRSIRRALTERRQWQAKEVALMLKGAFLREQPRIAVTTPGALPYWSELPALDLTGRNDYYLLRQGSQNDGRHPASSGSRDGRYVLGERPDMIVFEAGTAMPGGVVGEQLAALPEFRAMFARVNTRTEPSRYSAVLFVAKDSPRIGVKRSTAQIEIPGFFFTDDETIAWPQENGVLASRLMPNRDVAFQFDVEPGSTWAVDRTRSDWTGIDITLNQGERSLSVTLKSNRSAPVNVAQLVLRRAE